MEQYIIPCLLVAFTPLGVVGFLLLYKLASRAMDQTESMQRDHSSIVSEVMASGVAKETGDNFTAAQMLKHSDNHDHRKEYTPPIPQSFMPEVEEAIGPHISPDVLYGDTDDMEPPIPGEET